MSDALPEGWIEVTVAVVSNDISYGFTAKSDRSIVGPKYLRITDIQNGLVDWSSVPSCAIPSDRKSAYALLTGDIVFARTGATTGKSYLITSCPDAVFASYLIRVRPSPAVVPAFMQFFFQSPSYWAQISENVSGTAQPNCNASKLSALTAELPPMNEQERIVEKLGGLLAKAKACQTRLDKIPLILKRFRQAVLAAACAGKLTVDWEGHREHAQWEKTTLGEIIEDKPKNGYSAKPVKYKTAYRVLTLTATTSGKFDPRYFKYFDEAIPRESPLWLRPGDILIQRGNTSEYVGVPAIYDGEPHAFIYPDLMMRCRANPRRVMTKFLYFALASGITRNYLRERATGTAGTMPKINQQVLIGVPIELPPIPEQDVIVQRVEALFAVADKIEARYAKANAYTERLTGSIVAKAFRGELVPTEAELAKAEGRSYETAEELLARVRRLTKTELKPAPMSSRRAARGKNT